MAKRMQRLMVTVAALASLALGGAVFAQAHSASAKASPGSRAAHPAAVREAAGGVDRDNVQSGDQTTPDRTGTAAASPRSGEQSTEQSTEQSGESASPSDGPGGHADAPGANVDHQFQGNE